MVKIKFTLFEEQIWVGTLYHKELSCLRYVHVFQLKITEGCVSNSLHLSQISNELHLIFLNSIPPTLFDNQISLIDKEADKQETGRNKLHVAENFHNCLVLGRNIGSIVISAIIS